MNAVSYSWFRTDCPSNRPVEYYTGHWPALFSYFPLVYEDWQMVWHVAEDQLGLFTEYEQLPFVTIIPEQPTNYMSVGHLWRAMAIWDTDAEYVAQNDCDAVTAPRERFLRDLFIQSGFDGHVIRDDHNHSGQMLGGLCCWRADAVRFIYPTWESFIDGHEPKDRWQVSQWYLKEALWEKLPNVMSHNHDEAGAAPGERYACRMPRRSTNPTIMEDQAADELDVAIPIMGGGMA